MKTELDKIIKTLIDDAGIEKTFVEKQEKELLQSFLQRNIHTPYVKYLENKYSI